MADESITPGATSAADSKLENLLEKMFQILLCRLKNNLVKYYVSVII